MQFLLETSSVQKANIFRLKYRIKRITVRNTVTKTILGVYFLNNCLYKNMKADFIFMLFS